MVPPLKGPRIPGVLLKDPIQSNPIKLGEQKKGRAEASSRGILSVVPSAREKSRILPNTGSGAGGKDTARAEGQGQLDKARPLAVSRRPPANYLLAPF